MDLRETLDKRLRLKRKELTDLDLKVRELNAYIRALEDIIRTADNGSDEAEPNIRPDSDVGKTRDALKLTGKAMHIDAILKAIGRPVEKKSSLVSTLANYVRKGMVFTRTGPNVFGLVEFGESERSKNSEQVPPDDFGMEEESGPIDDDVPF